MSGIISSAVIEQIRDQTDIVDLIQTYVPLKHAGANYKGLCPFHNEKTPSFTVNSQKQIFHCFGCGKGGDAFRFIMDYEALEFPAAVEALAERCGVQLEYSSEDRQYRSDKQLLYDINTAACAYYTEQLKKSKGAAKARSYLADRKLSEEAREVYGIGYAGDRKQALLKHLEKNYNPEDLEKAGLAVQYENEPLRDKFLGRIMFPIFDEQERCVGFSGRVLKGDDRGAKYMNTPETPIFRKSKLLYGMHIARKAVTESRHVIICEGQIDVIRCHEHGFSNTVAPLGTALTTDHCRALRRHADHAILLYDADTAGQKAAIRSAELLLAEEVFVKVAALPEGEDPDSILLSEGTEALQVLLKNAESVIGYIATRQKQLLASDTGRVRMAKALLHIIHSAVSSVHKAALLQETSERLDLPVSALENDMVRLARTVQRRPAAPRKKGETPQASEEEDLLALLFAHPGLRLESGQYILPEHLSGPSAALIYRELLAAPDTQPGIIMDRLREKDDEVATLISRLLLRDKQVMVSDQYSAEDALHELIVAIRRKGMERKRKQLEEAVSSEDAGTDMERQALVYDLYILRQGWDKAKHILDMQD